MNKKAKNNKVKVVNWVLNILIVIATFFFLMTAGVMIEEFSYVTKATHSESSFYNALQAENYSTMTGNQYRNILGGHEGDKTMQEYYGVGRYYEAASLYNAYMVVGNEEQAAVFLEKMKKAEDDMGGLSVVKDAIHKQLGIE